jgi:peptide-methionine (S)-S-oxide reductase
MSTPQPPRRRLPVKPSEENLRKQAKRRSKIDGTQLAEAQQRVAMEYGCRNWSELMHVVATMNRGSDQLTDVARTVEPLHTAARTGAVQVVRELLAMGAPVDAGNSVGNTPLWLACQSDVDAQRRLAVAGLLLDAGANPRRECEDKSTPLHYAAWRGPLAMVELLLRHNAKEWQADKTGKTPLDYARRGVAAEKEAIVELLDRPVIRDRNFRAAVNAIQTGDLPELRRLLADHPNLVRDRAIEPDCYPPSYFKNPKLLWFVANNPTLMEKMPANIVDITAAFIDAGAEMDDLNTTLGLVMTSSAVRQQKLRDPLMNLLLGRGAKADESSLMATLGHGEIEPIMRLIKNGQEITAPLAAGLGLLAELAELLPLASADKIHAALSMAVINRQIEAARLCLQAGADVNQRLLVHAHSYPIHQAAINDDLPMMRLLLEFGAKLDVRDTLWQATPLGWAVHENKPAASGFLESVGGV